MRLALRVAVACLLAALVSALLWPIVGGSSRDVLNLPLGSLRVEFLAPRWLLLLGLAPLLWLIHSASLVDFSASQRAISLLLRTLLVVALALALARPAKPGRRNLLSVVFLVDVSRSVEKRQLDYAREVLRRSWRRRGSHSARVVLFAGRAALARLDGQDADSVPAVVRLDRDPGATPGTNIQAAIQHAHGLFPGDRIARLVLLSDGNETAGDALAEVDRLRSRRIRLHVFPLPARRKKEVLVQSLRPPPEVHVGAPFELTGRVHSTHGQRVSLTLYQGDLLNALEGRKQVTLQPGRNLVRFRSMVASSGVVSYRLVLSSHEHDSWRHNNSARAIVPVLGRPQVLLVDSRPSTVKPLREALQAEEIGVQVRRAAGLPRSAAQLGRFDLLVLSDVPATDLSSSQMTAIETYVRELGGGLLMIGGPESFGAGGYYGSQIERVLPVRMDGQRRRDQPSLALVLCIDRSGSMSGAKLELAKQAAKATGELLGADDLLGLVAFDSSAHVVVRLQRAAHRLRIARDIAGIRAAGGTSIYPALRESHSQLQLANAKVKHVILLSDGQSSYGSIAQLVDQMVGEGITVSAVGVGGGADRTLLQMVAARGNGRYYHTDEALNIPKIFAKETTQVARSALVEQPTRAHVVRRASMLKGLEMSAAPALRGYVSTRAKPLSEEILRTDSGEPLLIWWRVGLGKTAAFTSDAKARWGRGWLRWRGYRRFWAQLTREMVRHPTQRNYDLAATVRRDRVHVSLDARDAAGRFVNGLRTEVTLRDPQRPKQRHVFNLSQAGPGYYEGQLPLPQHGAFLVRARHQLGDTSTGESLTAISVPYAREYTHLVPQTKRLARLARLTGGAVSPNPARIFAADGQYVRYRQELWHWALFLALALFPLDVLVRRVRFRRGR